MTAVILMKNWTMSMTRTPQRPECVAKTTLRVPTSASVCHRGSPKRMPAILQAARFTVAMIMQLKRSPRYTERKPRTTPAAFPEYRIS